MISMNFRLNVDGCVAEIDRPLFLGENESLSLDAGTNCSLSCHCGQEGV